MTLLVRATEGWLLLSLFPLRVTFPAPEEEVDRLLRMGLSLLLRLVELTDVGTGAGILDH